MLDFALALVGAGVLASLLLLLTINGEPDGETKRRE